MQYPYHKTNEHCTPDNRYPGCNMELNNEAREWFFSTIMSVGPVLMKHEIVKKRQLTGNNLGNYNWQAKPFIKHRE